MDVNRIKSMIGKKIPEGISEGIIDVRVFGKDKVPLITVDDKVLLPLCYLLNELQRNPLIWLENLVGFIHERNLILSYFLRSSVWEFDLEQNDSVILRTEYVVPGRGECIRIPSILHIWAMAEPFEREISELFGVDFRNVDQNKKTNIIRQFNWVGNSYPLRKNFSMPSFDSLVTTRLSKGTSDGKFH